MLELFELIAKPLEKGDGFRHLWLGDSGMGKTIANTQFVDWLRATKRVDMILTLDDKSAFSTDYHGCERINVSDLRSNPPGPNEVRTHIVFRGVAKTRRRGHGCSPEELAVMAWEMATNSKCRTVLNLDELADATTGSQAWEAKTVALTYRKGRGVGICVTATTQLPQILPREAFALSETICLFRLSGREADYLVSKKAITPEVAAIIPTLPVGSCAVYDKNRGPLDGQVIKIDAP